MKPKELFSAVCILALGAITCAGATATWTGAGDGTSWNSGQNWLGGVVPANNADVLITSGNGSQVVLSSSASIRSLNCSKTLVVKNASLYLAGGASTISGTLWLTNSGAINVDNAGTTLAITGPGSLDGDLKAEGGAGITVSAIRSVTNYSYTTTFQAYGPGSYIHFTSLTNMSAAPNTRIYLEAYEGGSIDAHAVTKTSNGIQIYADGDNSEVDVSGLAGSFFSKGNHPVRLETRNGASILTGAITALDNADVVIRNNGVLPTAQLLSTTNSSITVDNASPSFASLRNIPDTELTCANGGTISLPMVTKMTVASYTVSWEARDAGTLIEFPALTNLQVAGNSRLYLEAYDGGTVDLHAVTITTNGVQALAYEADSLIDLSSLAGRWTSKGNHPVVADARRGGSILIPKITEFDNALLLIDNATVPTAQIKLMTNSTLQLEDMALSMGALKDIPDTQINVRNGGALTLPTVTSMPVKAYTVSWQVEDANSVLALPALTRLDVAPNSRLYLEAYYGGKVDVHSVNQTTNGVQAYAYEPNSVVDLSNLPGRWTSKGNHPVVADARRGGSVLIPKVTELDNALLFIDAATVPTAQIKLMTNSTLHVEDMPLSMTGLKDIPDTEIFVRRAGVLTLPVVTGVPVSAYTVTWKVENAASVLSLPALTRMDVAANSRLYLQAYGGGKIDVRNVTQTINAVLAYADEAGSVVDLSNLTGKWAAYGNHENRVEATDGGAVLIPKVTEMENTALYLRGVGAITTSQLTALRNCSIELYGSSPDFRSLRNIPNTAISAFDAGVARLTNVTQVDISEYTITWKAEEAGSLIDLSSLRQINVALNSRLFVYAWKGGRVDLSRLDSLTTGAVRFQADGAQSVIDLRGLSSFINIGDHDALLETRNDGSILLNEQAFILSGVQVILPTTHPVLPMEVAASSQTTLYGKPWRSYWIERRYMSPVSTDWMFTARVPLTNSFQPFTMYTPTNVVYRVWEFVADQPIVDPMPYREQNKFGVVLYGQPAKSYQLQSTRDFNPPWALESTVTMTNSFRIFPPTVMADRTKFYRAKAQ